ncbi:MAG: DUF3761 domain-containing protein [Thermomicrobiales bacterium]
MRRILVLVFLLASLVVPSQGMNAAPGTASCSDFDAWEWAQSVFDADPSRYASLDQDGNGIACDELAHGGFAPALWTAHIPSDAKPATFSGVLDGSAISLDTGSGPARTRLAQIDAPATTLTPQCGGQDATNFAAYVMSFNDDGSTVYTEDGGGYVWLTIDGKPYLLNEVLVRSGYAESTSDGGDLYTNQLREARRFAKKHDLGVWGLCGGMDVPLADQSAPVTTSSQSSRSSTSGSSSSNSNQGGGQGTYVGADGCTYTNVDGQQVSCPVQADSAPAGATARCNDGTYSFSQNHRGTCSHHGGVAEWLD